MRQRTIYTDEFRSEAIDLAINSDLPLSEIANNLGVKYQTLHNWVSNTMSEKTSSHKKSKRHTKELEAENRRLKRALKQAEQERDILKKATAYFASLKK